MVRVSIFIPTKNAGKRFEKVLKGVFKQDLKDFEVIIIDSGSKDNTLKTSKMFDIKIYQIYPLEFGHGKTRNLALKYAKGEFIVFLTQDAVPVDSKWLSNMIKCFKDKKVAGVFSKQIPRKNAKITEMFFYNWWFNDKKIIRPCEEKKGLIEKIFFSNVSSCVRKSIFRKIGFDENLIMSEDQEWAKDVFYAGYKTVYEPESIVIHSHDYTLKQVFQRYFDSAYSLSVITKGKFRNFTKIGSGYMIKEMIYVLKKKPWFIFYLALYDLCKIIATTLGIYQYILPLWMKKTFSMHKYYWKK